MSQNDPNHISPSARTPEELEPPDITPPPQIAAGMPAILETLKFASSEMGVIRGVGALLKINQPGGIDCPGCAWPDPDHERSHFEFCENGVKHVTEEATSKRVTAEFFKKWSVTQLSQQSDHWLESQGRLTFPMLLRRDADHYEPIDWSEAFKIIAHELNSLDHPDQAVFYTSGRTSNEAAFLYQLFVRQFGTNNLPDCSNMCHESSGWALSQTIGVGKGTVTLDDFDRAEAIFVIGQNPGTNHPRMLTSLLHAKRNGCKLVHINPLHETGMIRFKHPQEVFSLLGSGTKLADLFLQVRVNGDVALLKGISKAVLEREAQSPGSVLDHAFIAESTVGYDQFVAGLKNVSWQEIVQHSGVAKDEIEEAAEIFASSKRTMFCWAMGLTQHRNAVANIQEIVNLMLLRGQIGLPGAGLCPVRGHSNVQGDRTVGIWERPTDAFLDSLAAQFNFEPPRHHGLDTVDSIQAMHQGKIKVFFAMGGNFLSATPDTEFTAAGLRKCRLTAHVSTKINRSHLITGECALILPCLGRTELDQQQAGPQFVTTENSMGVIQRSTGQLEPASKDLLSEPHIVAKLARATLGQRSAVDWEGLVANYDRIRDAIEEVVPGFEDYNVRVRHDSGFYLPNAARERVFKTPDGKAHFTVHDLPNHQLEADQFLMTTIRSHDQFNTSVYSLNDRYRGISNGRRVIFLNPLDMESMSLSARQEVDLISHFEGEERIAKRFAVVPYDIPLRCAATYFPEANVLVPIRSVAEKSNTPTSKSVVISIRPTERKNLIEESSTP
ncbi:MAG TPA: FdhF/YdeP family oxidoreductase [Pyrinomonadaceae bacterium]|nr:FdhF/YdeP family oxidoreductase [Pyrinomonadaceae bacterium]